jgi:hypothetical protein
LAAGAGKLLGLQRSGKAFALRKGVKLTIHVTTSNRPLPGYAGGAVYGGARHGYIR